MANQPKKYKKFVATAATATLVASAIVPVASAAEFKDVAGNTHAEAINALADQGIINGYSDGTFKPNQTINRGQVVKLLGRWLEAQGQEIPADWKTEQRFNDLPVTAEEELVKYAALAKDAGVFNGSNGNLNYSETMQRQQMAVVLVRAINEIAGVDLIDAYKDADFDSEISDLDKAYSAEQREAIVALEYAEITQVSNFNPAESVTRGQFASFLYRTMNMEVVTDASVKAINNTTVEVTFDEEVEDIKALDFAIEGLEISNAAVKQTNKKVVVLTTSAQTADVEYTVTLNDEKIGTFKGITAVIPTAINYVESSIQATNGKEVTVKAQVTVPEGQSKADIPVTFNVYTGKNNDTAINPQIIGEAKTDANGVATYSYTRYNGDTDYVDAYATGAAAKKATAKVYWTTSLTLTEKTEGNAIANGAKKVYEISGEKNEVVYVTFKENMDITPDKAVSTVKIEGTPIYALDANGYVSVPASVQFPYAYTKGGTGVAAIKLDNAGKANLVVSGANGTVTPIVYTKGNTNAINAPVSAVYSKTDRQATVAPLTFQTSQVLKLSVVAEGDQFAATNAGGAQIGGRDYVATVTKADGTSIGAGTPVKVALKTTTTSAGTQVYDGTTPVAGVTSGDTTVFSFVTDKDGKIKFTVTNSNEHTYAAPIVFIDNSGLANGVGTLDAGDLQVAGESTYFTKTVAYKGALKLTNNLNKETNTFVASSTDTATFTYNVTDQNGKPRVLPVGLTHTTVAFSITTNQNTVEVFHLGVKIAEVTPGQSYTTSAIAIPTGGYSAAIEVRGLGATDVTVSAVPTVNNTGTTAVYLPVSTATATFTGNPFTVVDSSQTTSADTVALTFSSNVTTTNVQVIAAAGTTATVTADTTNAARLFVTFTPAAPATFTVLFGGKYYQVTKFGTDWKVIAQ